MALSLLNKKLHWSDMKIKSCYLAAPLFSESERTFNIMLAALLEREFNVYLPQRDGLLLRDMREIGEDSPETRHRIYETDIAAINACDVVLAVLDGVAVDDGVSFELGYATCLGKTIVGIATDSRRVPGYFRNPMWEGSLQKLFYSTAELVEWAQTFAQSRGNTRKTNDELRAEEAKTDSSETMEFDSEPDLG